MVKKEGGRLLNHQGRMGVVVCFYSQGRADYRCFRHPRIGG